MNGRWLGLCGAVVMTVSLASCSAKGQENGVGMLNNTGMSTAGYRTSTSTGRQYLPDSRYYADGDGTVKRYRQAGSSEWEQLGKALEDSWNELMKGTENTLKDAGKDTKNAAKDIGQGVENAAKDAKTDMEKMTGK